MNISGKNNTHCLSDEQINRFLLGEKSEDWTAHLADCADCRARLAAILAEKDSQAALPSERIESITNTIIRVNDGKDSIPTPNRIAAWAGLFWTFKRIAVPLAALVLVITIAGAMRIMQKRHKLPMQPMAFYELAAPIDSANQDPIVMDSLIIQGKRAVPETVSDKIKTEDRRGIIRISGKTGAILEKQTNLAFSRNDSQDVVIELNQGSATFSVEPNRYKSFMVITPTARVRVTGTVFSVNVSEAFTVVDVLKGTVDVENRNVKIRRALLETGDAAMVDADSVIVMMVKNSNMFRIRERLLNDFLGSINPDMRYSSEAYDSGAKAEARRPETPAQEKP